jgi:flagellar protein FlaI
MQTGHPVISTFHASSVEKLIQRLTGSPIEVPKTYIDNIGAVVIQSAVRVPSKGRVERRVISVNEIVGYDPLEDRFNFIELVSWDPITDTFIFKGEGSSFLLESKIAPMYGLSNRDVRKVYKHLNNRAELLRLLGEAHVFDYYDLWKIFKEVREIGVDKALELIRAGKLTQILQK